MASRNLKEQHNESERFSVIDIIRIFGGLLVLNALLSWWFTSSSTWGYYGKWLDPSYLKFRAFPSYLNLTLEELSMYNGSDPNLPIYVAVNGSVFDVSSSREIYGPKGGVYAKLSGTDSARVFVTGCFHRPDQFTYDLRGLDPEEADNDIRQWHNFYANHANYWLVGIVTHEKIIGDPPEPCEHIKFPG
ncbi:uncharacterized protein PRCAT00003761001 [Priceomyces carsonii]|uniref:uncharacterized protein n=1 Tax=Priceomyces carsonii TaxID=28549 RepID=UPI002EDADA21|nr:unnamed protein product [Priceomyces carsonii]